METNSITNYLTFNAADELTRVDKPSNAYDTYTYDNNGNCTQMDRYYPQPLLASRTDSTTTTNNNANTTSSSTNTENNNTNPSKLLMTHYPADYAPAPMNKWHNLSPYLPDVSQIDPISAKIASMIPDKAEYDRERRWREIAMPDTTPDETTAFTYSSDNNLTHVDLTNGDDLDFAYDAAGRRLEKKYTTVDSGTTYETKYTYHYIGSQITTIDIDGKSISGETETVTKDDQIRIHLGANTRPISFEYYTKNLNTEQTTSETYYYHYDLHGNVILVTDSSGTTQITYTYDQLGTVTSTTNSNSIYNPFTYMGEAQIIQDSEFDTSGSTPKTGLYNSGSGYYNPETGTSLGGSGAPAMTNPSSGSMEEPSAQCTKPAEQLSLHASIATVAGGVAVSTIPASSMDVKPEQSVKGKPIAFPRPETKYTMTYYPGMTAQEMSQAQLEHDRLAEWDRKYKDAFDEYWGMGEEWRRDHRTLPQDGRPTVAPIRGYGDAAQAAKDQIDNWDDLKPEIRQKIIEEELKRHPEVMDHIRLLYENYGTVEGKVYADYFLSCWVRDQIVAKLVWVAWGDMTKEQNYTMPGGSVTLKVKPGLFLMGYQLKGELPRLYWGPGQMAWSHHKSDALTSTDNLIGQEFSESTETEAGDGCRDTATQWARSWNMCGGNTIVGGITLHSMIFDSDIDKVVLGVTGSHKGDNLTDRVTVTISKGSVNMYDFSYGAGKKTLDPENRFADEMIVIYVKKNGDKFAWRFNCRSGGGNYFKNEELINLMVGAP